MAPDWSAPADRELFVRWLQFGAFSPVFRIHGKGERALFSNNWDELTKAVLLKYDNLRYRLMPYIYSLSWKVSHDAYTIMRALAFDFRTDTAVYNIKDQYMFGPAFLVNPVTDQIYSLQSDSPPTKMRKVYLPRSTSWVDFWTGETFAGGRTVDAAAPIETLPLYVKAGSIVPLGPFLQYATQKPANPLELRIYPGADGDFTLYKDDNDTNGYEKGEWSTVSFSWNDGRKTLTISDRTGTFPGMLKVRTFNIVLVQRTQGVGLEVCTEPLKTVEYTGRSLEIRF